MDKQKLALPKIEQIAFYTNDIDNAKLMYGQMYGVKDWKEDIVTARGRVWCPTGGEFGNGGYELGVVNVAHLCFNYDLGFELELIKYESGMNWHANGRRIGDIFPSHMAYHVEDMQKEVKRYEGAGLRVAQEVKTLSHTNEYLLTTGRKYHYVIFDSRNVLGFDLKLIKRIENGERS